MDPPPSVASTVDLLSSAKSWERPPGSSHTPLNLVVLGGTGRKGVDEWGLGKRTFGRQIRMHHADSSHVSPGDDPLSSKPYDRCYYQELVYTNVLFSMASILRIFGYNGLSFPSKELNRAATRVLREAKAHEVDAHLSKGRPPSRIGIWRDISSLWACPMVHERLDRDGFLWSSPRTRCASDEPGAGRPCASPRETRSLRLWGMLPGCSRYYFSNACELMNPQLSIRDADVLVAFESPWPRSLFRSRSQQGGKSHEVMDALYHYRRTAMGDLFDRFIVKSASAPSSPTTVMESTSLNRTLPRHHDGSGGGGGEEDDDENDVNDGDNDGSTSVSIASPSPPSRPWHDGRPTLTRPRTISIGMRECPNDDGPTPTIDDPSHSHGGAPRETLGSRLRNRRKLLRARENGDDDGQHDEDGRWNGGKNGIERTLGPEQSGGKRRDAIHTHADGDAPVEMTMRISMAIGRASSLSPMGASSSSFKVTLREANVILFVMDASALFEDLLTYYEPTKSKDASARADFECTFGNKLRAQFLSLQEVIHRPEVLMRNTPICVYFNFEKRLIGRLLTLHHYHDGKCPSPGNAETNMMEDISELALHCGESTLSCQGKDKELDDQEDGQGTMEESAMEASACSGQSSGGEEDESWVQFCLGEKGDAGAVDHRDQHDAALADHSDAIVVVNVAGPHDHHSPSSSDEETGSVGGVDEPELVFSHSMYLSPWGEEIEQRKEATNDPPKAREEEAVLDMPLPVAMAPLLNVFPDMLGISHGAAAMLEKHEIELATREAPLCDLEDDPRAIESSLIRLKAFLVERVMGLSQCSQQQGPPMHVAGFGDLLDTEKACMLFDRCIQACTDSPAGRSRGTARADQREDPATILCQRIRRAEPPEINALLRLVCAGMEMVMELDDARRGHLGKDGCDQRITDGTPSGTRHESSLDGEDDGEGELGRGSDDVDGTRGEGEGGPEDDHGYGGMVEDEEAPLKYADVLRTARVGIYAYSASRTDKGDDELMVSVGRSAEDPWATTHLLASPGKLPATEVPSPSLPPRHASGKADDAREAMQRLQLLLLNQGNWDDFVRLGGLQAMHFVCGHTLENPFPLHPEDARSNGAPPIPPRWDIPARLEDDTGTMRRDITRGTDHRGDPAPTGNGDDGHGGGGGDDDGESKQWWRSRDLCLSRFLRKRAQAVLKDALSRRAPGRPSSVSFSAGELTRPPPSWYAALSPPPTLRVLENRSKAKQKVLAGREKVGWIIKKGNVIKNFKRRFFVLHPGLLLMRYFENSSSSRAKGSIDLRLVRIIHRRSRDSKAPDFAFDLVTPSRTFVLCCETAEARKQWVDAILSSISDATTGRMKSMQWGPHRRHRGHTERVAAAREKRHMATTTAATTTTTTTKTSRTQGNKPRRRARSPQARAPRKKPNGSKGKSTPTRRSKSRGDVRASRLRSPKRSKLKGKERRRVEEVEDLLG